MFFLDEVGFNVSMRINYGRARVGERPVKTTRFIKTRNITVIAVTTPYSLFLYKIQNTSINKKNLLKYLKNLLKKIQKEKIENPLLILDNCRVHKAKKIFNFFKKNPGLRFKFLPAYSPFLNPIENFFSEWKNFVKRQESETEEELFQNIEDIKKVIEPEEFLNYFNLMKKNLFRCLNKEIFY